MGTVSITGLLENGQSGAKIVFHPQHTGTHRAGVTRTQWGAADGPYYEKAMMLRSLENTIYFASVNSALRFPRAWIRRSRGGVQCGHGKNCNAKSVGSAQNQQ